MKPIGWLVGLIGLIAAIETPAQEWFERFPKQAYWTEIESWFERPGDVIEFTIRRLPAAD